GTDVLCPRGPEFAPAGLRILIGPAIAETCSRVEAGREPRGTVRQGSVPGKLICATVQERSPVLQPPYSMPECETLSHTQLASPFISLAHARNTNISQGRSSYRNANEAFNVLTADGFCRYNSCMSQFNQVAGRRA